MPRTFIFGAFAVHQTVHSPGLQMPFALQACPGLAGAQWHSGSPLRSSVQVLPHIATSPEPAAAVAVACSIAMAAKATRASTFAVTPVR